MSIPEKKSAAELFASRTRQVVPHRTDDLTESLYPNEVSLSESSLRAINDEHQLQPNDAGLKALHNELDALPKVGNFQLRFEEPIKEQIKQIASQTGLTPETLLQGLWVTVQRHSSVMTEAVAEAKEHHKRRERAAELKNSITRLSNLLKKLRTY